MGEYLALSAADFWIYQVLLFDLAIAVLMIGGLRFVYGLVADVSTTHELASKDNFAFGISLAGGIAALAIMLTGVMSGEVSATLSEELVAVLGYGLVGIVLIKLGRVIQDKLVLTGIAIGEQIKQGNVAAAFVAIANSIATALVLRAVMIWVESDSWVGLGIVVAAFAITQLLLALVSYYRLSVYKRRNQGGSLQQALIDGNTAVSLRFLGQSVGAGLAMSAASGVAAFNPEQLLMSLLVWALLVLIFVVAVTVLAALARQVILLGVDVVEEVDKQGNVGVATIEAVTVIAVGLILAALFA